MNAIKRRVVCVEDEPEMIDLYRLILNRRGFEVIGADGGREGLEAIRQHLTELVLLDLMMPGISGEQVISELRATSDVPVIMLTAKASEASRLDGFDLGADDYVTKPFSPKELMKRIQVILKRTYREEFHERQILTYKDLSLDTEKLTLLSR